MRIHDIAPAALVAVLSLAAGVGLGHFVPERSEFRFDLAEWVCAPHGSSTIIHCIKR